MGSKKKGGVYLHLKMKMGSKGRLTGTRRKLLGIGLGITLCLFAAEAVLKAAESPAGTFDSPLTTSQVVSRMVEMNHRRTQALRDYTSLRSYHLELHGLIHIHADMVVRMTYHYPGRKEFTILSESGSAFMRNHVLKRLIEAENHASSREEHRQVSITPQNYNFDLVGYQDDSRTPYYILEVTPKVKRKYLFKGRIWVSAKNFAIIRIIGQPAKSLSWWTTKVNFVYMYKKVGEFWFPALNRTVTHVRIFGRSLLTINYKDYDLIRARNVQPLTPVKVLSSDRQQDVSLIPPRPSD